MKNWLVWLLLIVGLANVAGFGAREAYQRAEDLRLRADSAETHLREAEARLRAAAERQDFDQIAPARDAFAAARQDFAWIDDQIDALGPIYGLVELTPGVGEQARAARRLVRAGGYISLAGEESSQAAVALVESARGRPATQNADLVLRAAPVVVEHLGSALEALDGAHGEYGDLSEEGLHPLLAKALREMRSQVPKQRALLGQGLEAVRALPRALGLDGERVYLVLVQDAGELRPTGGFIGNYGIIRFHGGKIVEVRFDDSYRVDWPYYYSGKAPPTIGMFARYFPESTFWALRDSNVWPDFERSAMQAAWFAMDEGIVERVDGVIGITDDLVQPLMRVVGPITIAELDETVNEGNVLERIRHYQTAGLTDDQARKLGDKAVGNRKFFTSLVLTAIVQRVFDLDLGGLARLSLSLEDSIKSKGLQLYLADPDLQGLAETYGLTGHFLPVTGDYLWVVDMNLTPSKDNLYVKPLIRYSATVDNLGGAISEVELTYDYTREQGGRHTGTIQRPYHGNYIRAYVPPGSRLLAEDGTEEPVETYHEMGKTVFGNFVKVYPGTVRTVRLTYWQPLKLWLAEGKAAYELIVQKQAGNDVALEARVSLPEGAAVENPGLFVREGPFLVYRGQLRADTRLLATFAMP